MKRLRNARRLVFAPKEHSYNSLDKVAVAMLKMAEKRFIEYDLQMNYSGGRKYDIDESRQLAEAIRDFIIFNGGRCYIETIPPQKEIEHRLIADYGEKLIVVDLVSVHLEALPTELERFAQRCNRLFEGNYIITNSLADAMIRAESLSLSN